MTSQLLIYEIFGDYRSKQKDGNIHWPDNDFMSCSFIHSFVHTFVRSFIHSLFIYFTNRVESIEMTYKR